MLNVKVTRNPDTVDVEAYGKIGEILTDLSVVFNVVYHQMVANNPEMADGLKGMLKMAVMDDDSPFWRDIEIVNGTAVSIELPNK